MTIVSTTDLADVEAIVRAAGTSFYRGMAVLPAERKQAMYAIYAFCRIVDDIADEDDDFTNKLPRLAAWRQRIAALYRGETQDAVTRALLPAIRKFNLRQQDFLDMIDGMQMDAEEVIVAPSMAKLNIYCDRVAVSVGRLSVRAFGDASPAADRVALALGRALQLTNILRDIAEDADRGRLYLAAEYLDDAGIPHDPAVALRHPNLPEVCARMAATAQDYFKAAVAAMVQCDRRAMKPARLMGATYAAILARLQASRWTDPARRVRLPKWQQIFLALRYGLL
jgi:squalene synthase HpnD